MKLVHMFVLGTKSSGFKSRGGYFFMQIPIVKKPDLSDPNLRNLFSKGLGHNLYGELAWPFDLLYIFPTVILGTIACVISLSVIEPTQLSDQANPFSTPIEILPEWYFYATFNLLRTIPNKLLGVLSMVSVPVILLAVPIFENSNKFQNPFRRPIASLIFILSTFIAIWLSLGAVQPIDNALTLGLF